MKFIFHLIVILEKKMKILEKLGIIFVSIFLVISCASKPAVEEQKPVVSKKVEREMIDWKGASIGSNIPEWLYYAVDNDVKAISNLPDFENKIIYFAEEQGKNLDLLKSWVNNFNIQATFSRELSNFVIAKFGGELNGSKNEENMEMYLNELVATCSRAEINGLGKKLDYWVKTRYTDNELDIMTDTYQYFVVYAIDKDDFRIQLDRVLGKVEAKTEVQKKLKSDVQKAIEEVSVFAKGKAY
jgi:hypothetical protein